jgi:hypothetical protein
VYRKPNRKYRPPQPHPSAGERKRVEQQGCLELDNDAEPIDQGKSSANQPSAHTINRLHQDVRNLGARLTQAIRTSRQPSPEQTEGDISAAINAFAIMRATLDTILHEIGAPPRQPTAGELHEAAEEARHHREDAGRPDRRYRIH